MLFRSPTTVKHNNSTLFFRVDLVAVIVVLVVVVLAAVVGVVVVVGFVVVVVAVVFCHCRVPCALAESHMAIDHTIATGSGGLTWLARPL